MGETIERLRTKKGKMESGIKTCGVCGKEFSDQENFNWSCRTHQSEYSGEMWWCCGKLNKHDPGCKSGKHIVSNQSKGNIDGILNPDTNNAKCMCCKDFGHLTRDCPRDPNLKTRFNQLAELRRVQKIKFEPKLFIFTNIMTTKFLKTCIRVPKSTSQEDSSQNGRANTSIFQRGIMNFEDYNYRLFNPHILLDNQLNFQEDTESQHGKRGQHDHG